MTLRQRTLGLLLWLTGCSSAATVGESPGDSATLAKVTSSRKAWDALQYSMGDTYSYAEEDCVVNSVQGLVTTVQVEDGHARIVTKTEISRNECVAEVNRYDDFTAYTLPELYDACLTLVQREGSAVTIELDDRELLRGCTWPGDQGCLDNCGEGFYLRALDFGTLTVP